MRSIKKDFFYKILFWLKLIFLAPGIWIHELAHATFCILSGTKIYDIKIFQFSEVAGYVKHEAAKDILGAFLISFGPLFLNTFLAFSFFNQIDWSFNWKTILFFYLAVSISLASIPSNADAGSFGSYIKNTAQKNILFIFLFIFYPLVWFLNLLNFLKKYYFDYIYVALILFLALYY